MSCQVGCSKDNPFIFYETLDPFFGSLLVISLRCKEDKRYPLSKGRLSYTKVIRAVGGPSRVAVFAAA